MDACPWQAGPQARAHAPGVISLPKLRAFRLGMGAGMETRSRGQVAGERL